MLRQAAAAAAIEDATKKIHFLFILFYCGAPIALAAIEKGTVEEE